MSQEINDIPESPKNSPGMSLAVKVVIAMIALGVLGIVYNIGQSNKESEVAAILSSLQSFEPMVSEPKAPVTNNSDPMTDKSFHLDSVNFTNESGFGGANARITNISSQVRTAIFGLTIFAPDGISVAQSLMGSAEAVQPGQTITVQFVGSSQVPSVQFSYAFQVTTEF